ncbi:GIY-YIG nuclease family protein [Halocalculus aciditolerans]|uniref:hypothetical protein n=1 Tax=Halocalculus aciditolerans TaxID=1383812 RepID=UPI00166A9B24|nr:hypothetical protein [Halocalculus aciditolerans]
MSLDDFLSDETAEEYGDDLNDEDLRLIREFRLQEGEKANLPVVYGLYDRKTGELLYVGQTNKLIRRVSDHFRRTDGSQLLGLVERDDEINIYQGTEKGRDGNIWDRVKVKYIEIQDRSRRRKIENVLEAELDPRYPSK